MLSSTAVTLLASAAMVLGHGIVDKVVVGGTPYVGTKNWNSPENQKSPVRGIPSDTGFVNYKNVASSMDIACSSAGYDPRPVTARIPAGQTVDIHWAGDKGPSGTEWPHPEGPEIAYLASCNGPCSSFNPSNAKWFKIYEAGLDTSKSPIQSWIDHKPWGKGLWIQNKAMLEGSWFHVTIPKDIANGEYLLKHDLISLHGAHSAAEGAQYYPSCIQIEVTNGGSSKPAGIPATQLYTVNDGLVNIYEPYPAGIESYKIPGPAIYKAGSVAEPATTAAPSTTKAATSAAPTTTKAAGGVASTLITSTYPPTKAAAATVSSAAPAATSAKYCRAKRSNRARSLADESRAVYDRALSRAQARHAHVQKRAHAI
ncbi:hypothetical protein BDV93DRAFT_526628 [Ceratobasidium sp. AG-I]|nr:hypothetical protein BDV93DRAFT_526628 [Ceratobasidium sp. AG-I]